MIKAPQTSLRVAVRILWLAWLGLLPGTFVMALITAQSQWSRFWWISSCVLSMAAWVNAFLRGRESLGLFPVLIAVGMSFGMLADIYGAFGVIRFTEPLPMIIMNSNYRFHARLETNM